VTIRTQCFRVGIVAGTPRGESSVVWRLFLRSWNSLRICPRTHCDIPIARYCWRGRLALRRQRKIWATVVSPPRIYILTPLEISMAWIFSQSQLHITLTNTNFTNLLVPKKLIILSSRLLETRTSIELYPSKLGRINRISGYYRPDQRPLVFGRSFVQVN
jgi:hypothetical protein